MDWLVCRSKAKVTAALSSSLTHEPLTSGMPWRNFCSIELILEVKGHCNLILWYLKETLRNFCLLISTVVQSLLQKMDINHKKNKISVDHTTQKNHPPFVTHYYTFTVQPLCTLEDIISVSLWFSWHRRHRFYVFVLWHYKIFCAVNMESYKFY